MINGATTGGAGGPTVTVTNGTDFNTQINIAGPRIIQVSGPISIGRIFTTANKTIIGLGTNATLLGNLNISGVSNVIVRNLRISDPGNDGLTIRENGAAPGSHHIWIDHCTFFDCGDGACNMNNGAQYNTVSWCKFIYPTQLEHRFTMIADGFASGGTTNFGYYTLHHNWWSTRSDQRMAASSYGRIHYYNNFFNCTNNSYASNARTGTEINSQNNYYAGVNDAMTVSTGTDGKIQTSGNFYVGCTGTIHLGMDTVFTPPYAYTLDSTIDVPNLVTNGAGAPGPDTVPIPPKIWDGGGANNNLNTGNNWGFNGGYNEVPKEYDVLQFAGSTRLTPNNNFTANNEYVALNFSSNAGAFVLTGNALDLGVGITSDSSAVQTINLNLDFTYAADHFPMNRYFNVSASNGSLVINGNITGFTNIYGKLYSVTKLGPGQLTLAGINTFPGVFNFTGGLVRFSGLNTNLAGSLGCCTNLVFNGGGLQWAPENTSDLSSNLVTLLSGGAVFDVGTNSVTLINRVGNLMELDATTHTNDLIMGMTGVSYGGRLIVTNLSGTLAAGDTFKLFAAGSYSGTFTSITLPALNGHLIWTNKLAFDGTLAVISPVNTTPLSLIAAVVGDSIQVTWPADHIGWRLEAQTNALTTGLTTNWFAVAGFSTTNQIFLPIDLANGSVFLRLTYP